MSRRRVVVTGMGIVSPVGIGLAAAWDSILAARSGIAPITRFDCSTFPTRIAGEVKDFDVGKYLSAKEARRYDTFIHYGLVATMEAIADAGLDDYRGRQGARRRVHRLGHRRPADDRGHASKPTSGGGCARSRRSSSRARSSTWSPDSCRSTTATRARTSAIVSACSTANHSIGEAARIIEYGDADVMIAGGAEATVSAARHRRLLRRARAVARATTIRRRPAGRGTSTATASCWARAPASSCSRSTSTRRRAARGSTASSPATA